MDSVKLIFAIMFAAAVVQLHASGQSGDTKIKLFDIAVDFRTHNLCPLPSVRANEEFLGVTELGVEVPVLVVVAEGSIN